MTSTMASCCLTGFKHDGESVGEYKDVAGTKTYISHHPEKKTEHGILYLCDALGMELVNNRLLADSMARAGYLVVMPDLFHGEPVPSEVLEDPEQRAKFDFPTWLAKHPRDGVDKIVTAAIKAMREEMGVKKIGAVGYCFGGKYVTRFLGAAGKSLDAGFTAHPSLVEQSEMDAVRGPLSIAAAEIDQLMSADQRFEVEKTLEKVSKEHGIPYQLTLYGAVEHGFAVKTDRSDPRKKFAMESAYVQAIRWFDEFVKN